MIQISYTLYTIIAQFLYISYKKNTYHIQIHIPYNDKRKLVISFYKKNLSNILLCETDNFSSPT